MQPDMLPSAPVPCCLIQNKQGCNLAHSNGHNRKATARSAPTPPLARRPQRLLSDVGASDGRFWRAGITAGSHGNAPGAGDGDAAGFSGRADGDPEEVDGTRGKRKP